jgi:hypothetical protein
MSDTRRHLHELIERLEPAQLAVLEGLLKAIIDADDHELSDADRRAVAASREYFAKGGLGVSFEQVVGDLGFTMDQVRGPKSS